MFAYEITVHKCVISVITLSCLFIVDSEDDLSSMSDSPSLNSTPQNENKQPLSPRDFWREKAEAGKCFCCLFVFKLRGFSG